MEEIRNLCILGSTGSIGTQTLQIIDIHGGYRVVSLAAMGGRLDLLYEQVAKYCPKKVCVYDSEKAKLFEERVKGLNISVLTGMEGLIELCSDNETDVVVTAVVGMIGIKPTITAIEHGKDIALANKETLVTAGHLIMPLAAKHHVRILPVDSEHSAIFQCLQGKYGMDGYYTETEAASSEKAEKYGINKLLLTASGGPFRGKTTEELAKMTVSDALNHPNWSMGKKITIDSASMVNKALEVMEARWLFGVAPENIQIVVQPKSIIHSAVEFKDGSIIAQLGSPDMRVPIQYALYYPERIESPVKKLDLFEVADIRLERPDYDTFRGLKLGLEAIKKGGSICTVFNAANEFAVAAFLDGRISFLQIYEIIEEAMKGHTNIAQPSLEEILETEKKTYELLEELLNRWSK